MIVTTRLAQWLIRCVSLLYDLLEVVQGLVGCVCEFKCLENAPMMQEKIEKISH